MISKGKMCKCILLFGLANPLISWLNFYILSRMQVVFMIKFLSYTLFLPVVLKELLNPFTIYTLHKLNW